MLSQNAKVKLTSLKDVTNAALIEFNRLGLPQNLKLTKYEENQTHVKLTSPCYISSCVQNVTARA
jgi:biotin synthase-related radical SAM superfamily protein